MVRAQCRQLVFTKWHDKRDVAFFSTNVSPDEPSRPVPRIHNKQNVNIEKPRVSDVYTAHKGGVDRADQLRSFYCSGWQSKTWYRYIFWFLFNVSVCNAFVLESEHVGSKRESVYFKLDLTQQSMVFRNKNESVGQTRFHQTMLSLKISMFQFV